MFEWNDGTELFHHGILGMKWGVRRFENYDGTLTEEGKKRYGLKENASKREIKKALKKSDNKNWNAVGAEYEKELLSDKELKKIESQRAELWKKANQAYASEYNKLARANGLPTVNVATFDFYEAFDEGLLDSDIEEQIWGKDAWTNGGLSKIMDENDRLVKKRTDIETAIAKRYVSKFNEARLKDLNYVGSKAGGEKLLKKYGGAKVGGGAQIDFNGRLFNFKAMYSPDEYFERLGSDEFFDL